MKFCPHAEIVEENYSGYVSRMKDTLPVAAILQRCKDCGATRTVCMVGIIHCMSGWFKEPKQ